MIALLCFFLTLLASLFKSKSRLEAENAALRHQLIVLRRRCAIASTSFPKIQCWPDSRDPFGSPWRESVLWSCRRRAARLVLRCARVARPVGPVGIDVERPHGALDDLFRDYDFLYVFEARQVEHRVEQDTF